MATDAPTTAAVEEEGQLANQRKKNAVNPAKSNVPSNKNS
jgi:hypothetical protein